MLNAVLNLLPTRFRKDLMTVSDNLVSDMEKKAEALMKINARLDESIAQDGQLMNLIAERQQRKIDKQNRNARVASRIKEFLS